MKSSIEKSLPELVSAGIISDETSQQISGYFANKPKPESNRLLVIFGILGALLTGLGIILIIAHNWDELGRQTKTILSFVPLLAGQGFVAYSLFFKKDSVVWKESSATFLFLAIGATISLIAQIYNLSGDLNSFLITWMLLGLPLVYLLPSSMAGLLYIIGVTGYGCNAEYFTWGSSETYWHWGLLALVVPYYFRMRDNEKGSNFFSFFNWMLALSVIILLGTFSHKTEELLFIAYFSLGGCYTLIGSSPSFSEVKRRNNPWLVLGSFGSVSMLLTLSFRWFWDSLSRGESVFAHAFGPELIISVILTLTALYLLYKSKSWDEKNSTGTDYMRYVFLVFIVVFIIGDMNASIATVLVNLIIFLLGIHYIRKGSRIDHLGILNYGLLILAAVITCRYFDSRMSFLLRGITFILIGVGFFLANSMQLKKRRQSKNTDAQ